MQNLFLLISAVYNVVIRENKVHSGLAVYCI